MDRETSKCFLDTNFITDTCSAEILAEFKSYAEMSYMQIIIPGEVYAEANSGEMAEFLSQMSLDKDSVVLEQPPLLEKDRARTISGAYAFGAGEEHVAVMARWFRANGQKVLAITSDKKAQKMLVHNGISNIGIYDALIKLNHSRLLPKEQAMTAIKRLEKSRNKMKGEEKEMLVCQLK